MVTSEGVGAPLVLLPANGHAACDFDAIRPYLARRFRVYALDWPAMDASSLCSENIALSSASLLGDALLDALDGLELERPLLMGHSVGGFAAARVASQWPERVRALVLVSPGGFAEMDAFSRLFCAIKGTPWITRSVEAHFARYHTKRRNDHTRAMFERIEAMRTRSNYADAVAAVWRSFVRPESDLRELARAIRCSTLIVAGQHDPVIPMRAARAAHAAISGSELATMDTGHSCFVEDPEGFLEIVHPFFERVFASARGEASA